MMKAFSFSGSGLEYFKIWIVNVLLIIVSLGLYYPWAKVRNKRYFYANTQLEARNFEYHATGKQLFLGFLLSAGMLLLYTTIQSISPVGSLVLIAGLFLAFPWLFWQSLKFNMRMTSFSNVHFSFDAGLGQAYINYMLIPMGAFVALYGLPIMLAVAIPAMGGEISTLASVGMGLLSLLFFALVIFLFAFMKKRTMRYTMNGSRYGQGQFSSRVETNVFAKILFKATGLGILMTIAVFVALGVFAWMAGMASHLQDLPAALEDPEATAEVFTGALVGLVGLAYLGVLIISMVVFSYLYSRQREYIFANTELDNKIAFASTLKARTLAWISVTNLLAILVTFGLAFPWVQVRMSRFVLAHSWVDTSVGFDEYLTQQQDEQSSLGDQIGDAFDLDMGVGL